ncbi:MAG TPA: PrsW family glutamic-type intramembrane protease [Puia sp.]|nr:PrsW family glutamic-type intramembrane protease [Puia sp.]
MLLLALAVAPAIAVCLFIYSLHKYGRTSIWYLVLTFLFGMIATFPALRLQELTIDPRTHPWRHSILFFARYAFLVIAFSEEGCKFLVLRIYAYPRSWFKGPLDGIVYTVMIGMGFATVENIEYVRQFGLEAGVSRFFLAVPAHASFAVLMGYPAGKAKTDRKRSFWWLAQGLAVAVLFHGSFDFFLFLQQSSEAQKYLSTGMLSFGTFASFYIAVRLAMRAIRRHSNQPDQSTHLDN